jgi:hypothetical protein
MQHTIDLQGTVVTSTEGLEVLQGKAHVETQQQPRATDNGNEGMGMAMAMAMREWQ